MSDRVRAWLAQRSGTVPPELAAEMEQAVDEASDPAAPIPTVLADAAHRCLLKSFRNSDQRAAALPLLAADALLTYACEAAAETARASLDELTRSCEPDRLARLLPDADPT